MEKKAEVLTPVVVETPRIGDIERILDFTGTVKAFNEALVFPDLPGRFMKYLKPEESYVKKDEPIALIEREVPGLEFKPLIVKSPIDGRLSQLGINKGETVYQQRPIARIVDPSSLIVEFALPERYTNALRKGDKIKVETLSGSFSIAKVNWVAAFLDPLSHTRTVKAKIITPKDFIPGMSVKLYVSVQKAYNVMIIPYNSVVWSDTSYVVGYSDGKVMFQPISIGVSDENNIEIKSGISLTDSILVVGQRIVRDGEKVRLVEKK